MSSSQLVDRGALSATAVEWMAGPRWYAVRTRSRHEKMVTTQLERIGLEAYLPVTSQVHKWSDRKRVVEVPLFSGYSFVRVDYHSENRVRVLQTNGVVNFVGVQNTGSPIPDGQIDDIRQLLARDVPFQEHSFLRIGQRVRVRGGSLDGVEGILEAKKGDRSLVISLEPIERSLSIRIDGYEVEPL
jgi:transcription antitermination factor NusG